MLRKALSGTRSSPKARLSKMSSHLPNGRINGAIQSGVTLEDLPKTSVFTTNLPPDPQYPKPATSDKAPRSKLGPRTVRDALYTYVRPEPSKDARLVSVSPCAMEDIGLAKGEDKTDAFAELVCGNRLMGWNAETEEGVYPWAQCYGGE